MSSDKHSSSEDEMDQEELFQREWRREQLGDPNDHSLYFLLQGLQK